MKMIIKPENLVIIFGVYFDQAKDLLSQGVKTVEIDTEKFCRGFKEHIKKEYVKREDIMTTKITTTMTDDTGAYLSYTKELKEEDKGKKVGNE